MYSTAPTDRALFEGESYSSAEMKSVYSTAHADGALAERESYPSVEMKSVYSTAPADWTEKIWRVSRSSSFF